ncbi:hypothetical protein GGS21DRAFT_510269 [Xylaria nigripes]|nr:hypothetical protein GGS21DRAFT_510269 [Xylaria nigripes]
MTDMSGIEGGSLRRVVVLFGLMAIAVTIVDAQSSPWGQIGGVYGNPYNPNYNSDNNNDDNNNNSNNNGDNGDNDTNNDNTNVGTHTNSSNNGNGPNGNNGNPISDGNHGGLNNGDFSGNPFSPGPGFDLGPGFNRDAALYYRDAHGILAAGAFAFLFPLGSILMRVVPSTHTWLLHATVQIAAYTVYIAAAGLGIKLVTMIRGSTANSTLIESASTNAHPIIGIVLLLILLPQPLLGIAHHKRFKNIARRTWVSHAHLWLGRLVIALGIVNGGLGLLLASAPSGPVTAYAVIAGVMAALWLLTAAYDEYQRTKQREKLATKEVETILMPPDDESRISSSPAPNSNPNPNPNLVAELPPYTPGPHYGAHMAHVRRWQEEEQAQAQQREDSGKADFEVVPLVPLSHADMYRGQVSSPDEVENRGGNEEDFSRGQV